MIENLSQLKKYLATENASLTLTYYKFGTHKFLNITRGVEKLQTNSVKLEGGSWLNLNKASDFIFKDGSFDVIEKSTLNPETNHRDGLTHTFVLLSYKY